MAKKESKTYNHYVPQFYFRNFSGNNSIGVYNFDRKRFVDEDSISSVAGQDFLYGKDNDLEDWFRNLESKWAPIIKSMLVSETLPVDSTEYTYLLMFVYLSDVRTAEKADDYKKSTLEEAKRIVTMISAQDDIDLTDDDMEGLDVKIDRPNLSYIQGMPDMIKIIADLCPLIIVNESEIGFLTSDNPVAKYNKWFMERNYQHPYGFGHIGFQCFVPLSPRICFCLYDDTVYKNQFSDKNRVRLYKNNNVEELNKLFIQNSYTEIYYAKESRGWLEDNVGVKKEYEKEEWIMGSPQDGYLQKVSNRCVFDYFNMPIFKTNSFFKTAPFPYCEAGPLRKSAYEILEQKDKD